MSGVRNSYQLLSSSSAIFKASCAGQYIYTQVSNGAGAGIRSGCHDSLRKDKSGASMFCKAYYGLLMAQETRDSTFLW